MNERKKVRVRDVMSDGYIRADGLETVKDVFLRLKREDARCIIATGATSTTSTASWYWPTSRRR